MIVCNINQIKKSLLASLRKSSALASVDTSEIEDLLYHQGSFVDQWIYFHKEQNSGRITESFMRGLTVSQARSFVDFNSIFPLSALLYHLVRQKFSRISRNRLFLT